MDTVETHARNMYAALDIMDALTLVVSEDTGPRLSEP